MTFEFNLAQNELQQINSLLKTKCPELELELDTKSVLSDVKKQPIESYTKSKCIIIVSIL